MTDQKNPEKRPYVWDWMREEHVQIQSGWAKTWGAAEIALRPWTTWRDLTKSHPNTSDALDILIPKRPAGAGDHDRGGVIDRG